MMKQILKLGSLAAILFIFAACGGESTDAVESGTYEGTIQKVVPAESEIYVETPDDKTLELYFIDETKLTMGGSTVPFDSLENGQKVRVEVKKVGKRLDPLNVEILQ
jgi:hypothetical protein